MNLSSFKYLFSYLVTVKEKLIILPCPSLNNKDLIHKPFFLLQHPVPISLSQLEGIFDMDALVFKDYFSYICTHVYTQIIYIYNTHYYNYIYTLFPFLYLTYCLNLNLQFSKQYIN